MLRILGFTLLLGSLQADCPAGWNFLASSGTCYSVSNQASTYAQAVRTCQLSGGDVVKITDAFTNQAIVKAIQNVASPAFYIGVEQQSSGAWTYTDGTPLTYQNWANAPASGSNSSEKCAVIAAPNTTWQVSNCGDFNGFVCSKPVDQAPCPKPWFFSNVTGYCYYLKGFTMSDGKLWDLVDGTEAEVRCRQLHANSHLVSMRDEYENQVVYDQIKTSNLSAYRDKLPENHYPCLSGDVLTGLRYANATGFSWTDGTPMDYTPQTYKTDGFYYGVVNDASCGGKYWVGAGKPKLAAARYMCKMSPP
ncbi:unnamed protein product, partial [Mesorhabditis spiculigera]